MFLVFFYNRRFPSPCLYVCFGSFGDRISIWLYVGFPKMVVPQNGWFIMEKSWKWMIWGTTISGNTHILHQSKALFQHGENHRCSQVPCILGRLEGVRSLKSWGSHGCLFGVLGGYPVVFFLAEIATTPKSTVILWCSYIYIYIYHSIFMTAFFLKKRDAFFFRWSNCSSFVFHRSECKEPQELNHHFSIPKSAIFVGGNSTNFRWNRWADGCG